MDREQVRAAFREPEEFTTSPLYRCLSRTVAATDQLLDLAGQGRPGQYPTFLFFGAVHLLLLAGTDHPLARFYPSVAGERALPPEGAGPALVTFGREHAAELAETIRTRLVQTNQVQRATGLRLGLSVIAAEVPGPVHVIEAGTSAGLNLRFGRYGYRLNGRQFGDPCSPVQLIAECHGQGPQPDLDRQPAIASLHGIDLHPVDATDPGERAWLQALVWPENHRQRALLTTALELAAADPPPILAGDVIDVLPGLAGTLPAGQPRVVFHSATRLHVPASRLAAFDAAIERAGDTGPLWWLSIEDAPDAQCRPGAATAAARHSGGRDDRHRGRPPRLDRDVPAALAAGPGAGLPQKAQESCDTERPAARNSRSWHSSVYD